MASFRGVDLPPGLNAEMWPVVVYTAPASIEDTEFKLVLDAMAAVRSHGEPYAMILDLRISKGISPAQRRMITTSMGDDDQQRQLLVRGVGLIFSSRLMTSLLTAIFWVRKPGYEVKVFSALSPALAWGHEMATGQKAVVGIEPSPPPA